MLACAGEASGAAQAQIATAAEHLLGCRATACPALPSTASLSESASAHGPASVPLSRRKKLRPREAEQLACGHTAVSGKHDQTVWPG